MVEALCLCCSKTCPAAIFFAIVLSLSPSFKVQKSSGAPIDNGIEGMRGIHQIPLISVTYPCKRIRSDALQAISPSIYQATRLCIP